MTPKTVLTGLGAFVAGTAALVAVAVLGEAYVGKLPERADDPAPEPAPAAVAALIEAPHVAEERDGPVDTAPGAPGVAAAKPAPAEPAVSAEHVPTDLLADANPGEGRAPEAFRPDPTAPVPPELRESLRPATGPAKAFAANEGETVTEALNPG